MSIPRLELTTATLSVKISKMLQKELDAELTCNMTEYYWTDSTVVLGYINYDLKRFKVFVANCIQLIRAHIGLKQWHYVNTANKPADYASRCLDIYQKKKFKNSFKDHNSSGTTKVHGVCIMQI